MTVALLSHGPTARLLMAVGVVAVVTLGAGIAVPSPATIGVGLAFLGGEYCLRLVLDGPSADGRAAVVAAALLAAGEFAFWSIELRGGGTREPGRRARRLGSEFALGLGGLTVAALVLAIGDVVKVRGLGIELVGGAAAAALLSLAVRMLRPER